MTIYYKWLNPDGTAPYTRWQWPLPTGDGPGEWTPVVRTLVECERGYHLCQDSVASLLEHLGKASLPRVLWMAEPKPRSKRERYDDKFNVQSARLVKRVGELTDQTARLFAVDCATRVLPPFEQLYPNDPRPRDAIAVAYRYARGEATTAELRTAGSVVSFAAYSTATNAATYATKGNANDAARLTAYAMICYAATAAIAAEGRAWQLERLLAYVRGETA